MHGHCLLKLTARLAPEKKCRCILLYSCKSFVFYLMHVYYIWTIYAEIVLPELFEESH